MDIDKKFTGAIFGLMVLLIFNLCSYTPFTVNTSPSVTRGIYFVVPKMFAGEYEKGDMVIFNPPADVKTFMVDRGYIMPKDSLLKQIKALEGDRFTVDDRFIQIDGEYAGTISTIDSNGREIKPFYGEHTVEKGYFLPMGTAVNSYDGRYFGCVPLKSIKNKVILLIKF